jgi:hypothetical protein
VVEGCGYVCPARWLVALGCWTAAVLHCNLHTARHNALHPLLLLDPCLFKRPVPLALHRPSHP